MLAGTVMMSNPIRQHQPAVSNSQIYSSASTQSSQLTFSGSYYGTAQTQPQHSPIDYPVTGNGPKYRAHEMLEEVYISGGGSDVIYHRQVNAGHRSNRANNSQISGEKKRRDRDDDPIDEDANLEDKKKIQVQILPQDDNWGQNTTAMTGDLSGGDFNDDMTEDGRSMRFNPSHSGRQMLPSIDNLPRRHRRGLIERVRRLISRYVPLLFTITVIIGSFISPIVFVVLPRLELNSGWQPNECSLECEGLLIGIAFKLFILLIGFWTMQLTELRRHQLPRACGLKVLLVFILFLVTFSYWLFYIVRIVHASVQDYFKILQFAASYVDVLLIVFVVGVLVLELRHLRPVYVVRVVRSPDGEQAEYEIGAMSIQRAAVFILDRYYRDFKPHNPWAENAIRRRNSQFVQIESKKRSRALASASSLGSARRGQSDDPDSQPDMETKSSHKRGNRGAFDVQSITNIVGANLSVSERLLEESENERRIRRKRTRLIATTEEAFAHIRRIQPETSELVDSAENGDGDTHRRGRNTVMDPIEAAQAIFTSIARDLRRYLRATHQQPFFTRPQIVAHLADSISYDVSPKAFLQRYISGEGLLFNERAQVNAFNHEKLMEYREELLRKQVKNGDFTTSVRTLDQTWILISESALCQNIEDNLMVVLKQNDVTLMCSFKRLPRFKLIEDVLDPKRNKFVLKLNSETTV